MEVKFLSQNRLLKSFIYFSFILFFSFFGNGANCGGGIECSCGDTVVSNYVMSGDLNCEGNGLNLQANIDCDGFSIIGSGAYSGIKIEGYDNRVIENCNIKNFSQGVYLTYKLITSGNGWGAIWTTKDYPINTNISNNVFIGNSNGVSLQESVSDKIYNNRFIENSNYGIYLNSKNSRVWNNDFYETGVYYSHTGNNRFWLDDNEKSVNNYFNGSQGPGFKCMIPFDNLVVDSNLVLCENKYNVSSLNLKDNVKFDCSHSDLIGDGESIGIIIDAYDGVSISNCNFINYTSAIDVRTRKEYNTNSWGIGGWTVRYSESTNISNNVFINNNNGVVLQSSVGDNIYNNSFVLNHDSGLYFNGGKSKNIFSNNFDNNTDYGIYLKSSNSKIWANNFSGTGIYYTYTGNNRFWLEDDKNSVNNYFNGAQGPGFKCMIPFDNLVVNSDTVFCRDEYSLLKPISMRDNFNLDCNGAKFVGDGLQSGVLVNGYGDIVIEDCAFENFTNAVDIRYRKEWTSSGWKYYYPHDINVTSSVFINNLNGISAQSSSGDNYYNNDFIDNLNYGVSFFTSRGSIWGNSFYGKGISYGNTKDKSFCYNNVSNLYFDGAQGPKCECIIPLDRLIVDSDSVLCYGEYNMSDYIRLKDGVELNCNNATLIGNDVDMGVYIGGVSNTVINSCKFEGYDVGVKYLTSSVRNHNTGRYYPVNSLNNEVYNSMFLGVGYGLQMTGNAYAKEVHGNVFLASDYNIYNTGSNEINATYNWWGTVNESLIEPKILRVDDVIYKPYLEEGIGVDFEISEDDISFLKLDNGSVRVSLKLHNLNNEKLSNLEIELIDVYDYTVEKKVVFNVTNVYEDKVEVEYDWDLDDGCEVHVVVDPNDNFNDIDKSNNYAKKVFTVKDKYFLDVNIFPDVASQEVENYLKESLGSQYSVNDIDDAQVIIRVGSDDLIDNSSLDFGISFQDDLFVNNFLIDSLPYESEVRSFDDNGKHFVEIRGVDFEGDIAGVKFFVDNKDYFLNDSYSTHVDSKDIDAIKVYDYFHSPKNEMYFKDNINFFGDIVRDVLYDNMYGIREMSVGVDNGNSTIDYKLYRLLPKNSLNYRNFVDKDSLPILWVEVYGVILQLGNNWVKSLRIKVMRFI